MDENKDYIPCEVDAKTVDRVTKEYGVIDTKILLFPKILLSANPDPIPIEAIEIEPTKKENLASLLNFVPQSGETYDMPKEEATPKSLEEKPTYKTAEIENELDNIFAKIQINTSKIKYLEAQLYMLNEFYDTAFKNLSDEARAKILEEIPLAKYGKRIIPTPTFKLVEDLPCKLDELKFLLKLVGDYDRSSQRNM